jgi:hypothetical protein
MAFWLKDAERSPFGLGWEYHRRGEEMGNCPFDDLKSIRMFEKGFKQFRSTKPRTLLYHDPEVRLRRER